MAFDQKTRNLLQRTVAACRRVLDREFTAQLQELYGIQPDGSLTPVAALDHLGDEALDVARLLRERINHLEGGSAVESFTRTKAKPEHIARVIREQAFTVLNRLAALRLCEERGLVLECARKGVNSEGFQLFTSSAGNALGETHEAYRVYLHCLFDELALDLGVLFDRFSPLALLFPRHAALTEVLSELNGTGKAAEREEMPPEQFAEIWQADETIGWIYQYYNDETERKKMREESAAPRNSRELAVRNQFFTPRYVVEFLTDNTLGRIWYEMTQGDTTLKEQCRYLVRRPNEIFLKPGENPPATSPPNAAKDSPSPPSEGGEGRGEVGAALSQEDLLKQPVFIPHRPLKDPRTILMLDPACGSMHFGLYAFDLFEVIYDEAWALEEKLGADALSRPPGMKSLHATYAGKDAFLKDVPRLIIEHNLHGIDIDPRCAQIAGLSLWLRAQKAWQRLGLKPAERPAIKRSNIVCAEPMPGEKELLREFVEREFPAAERAVCLRLLEAIFDKMQLAGEAGSLLKIEEEIRSAIEDARDAWQKLATKPQELFTTTELNQLSTAPELTGLEQAVSSLTTAPRHLTTDFWERIEEHIYAALRDYAEQAENGGGFQRRLFAEDAARGFAFIDVCRKRYDVALMNPPFGECAGKAFDYVDSRYASWNDNVLCAFVKRGWELCCSTGSSGIIYDRTAIVKSTYEDFRRGSLVGDDRLFAVADMGWEVLDANVEVTSSVLHRSNSWGEGVFADLRAVDANEKADLLGKCISELGAGRSHDSLVVRKGSEFGKLPNAVLGYDFPDFLQQAFATPPSLEAAGFKAYQGHALKSEKHFRVWWELGPGSKNSFAARLFNGAGFAPYQTSLLDCVIAPVALEHLPKDTATVLRNSSQHLRPGVSFGKRGEFFCANFLPQNHVFTMEGQFIPVVEPELAIELLCFLNTPLVRFALNKYCGQHKTSGYVNLLPYRRTPELLRTCKLVQHAIAAISKAKQLDELQPCFCPLQLRVSVRDFANQLQSAVTDALSAIHQGEEQSHKELLKAFGVSSEERAQIELFRANQPRPEIPIEDADYDEGCSWLATHSIYSLGLGITFGRWDIRYATGEQAAPELPDPFAPLPVCPPGQLQNAQGLPARPEDVPAAYPVRIPWDGILVDDPNHPLDLERRVREVIEIIWSGKEGGPTAEAIEHEACEILGVKSLRDYFRKPAGFFADHLKRYSKSRRQAPIYWPLSTASGSYTLWIYYHRLTDQTLYKCIQQFIDPRLADVEKELTHLRTVLAASEGGAKERKRLEELEDLRRELIELRTELELWAPKWKPNLNDGVLITAAPLWKLFRQPKWQKDLKACWQELEKGEYDWAHLAYTLWPDRVREKCKTDRSLAIAHGLEELCEVKAPVKKAKKAKMKETEEQPELSED